MRRAALALALLIALALPVGTAVAASNPVTESDAVEGSASIADLGDAAGGFAQQAQPSGEWDGRTEIVVSLQADRDARWRVVTRYSLDTANETAAFRRYADAFEAGQAEGSLEADLFRRIANASAQTVERPMAVRNVSRSARVDEGTGALVLSFTWTNFLSPVPDSDLLVLQDAFVLPDGQTWLATLQPDQQLVVQTPPGYTLNYSSVPVQPVSGSVVIDGPRNFGESDPLTIRYRPTPEIDEQFPWELVVGGLIALAVVSVVVLRRRGGSGADRGADAGGQAGRDGPPIEPDRAEAAGSGSSTEADSGGSVTGGADTPGNAADTDEESGSDETETGGEGSDVDLSLLSDEERVEHLLDQRGGRMRQAEIVEETGWSDAKVSQLLSSMDEEGRIEKLRIGRENLISLPDADLTEGSEADDAETDDAGDSADSTPADLDGDGAVDDTDSARDDTNER